MIELPARRDRDMDDWVLDFGQGGFIDMVVQSSFISKTYDRYWSRIDGALFDLMMNTS